MNERTLRTSLCDLPLGGIRYYSKLGSTNDTAFAWASAGAPDLGLVIANEQTAGRGRNGHRWFTPPGAALAFSLVLHPQPEGQDIIPLYAGLGAVAVATALEKHHNLKPVIKWPNDVLIQGCKIGGILAEASWLDDQLESMVLGIGVNISSKAVPEAEFLDFPATCLETASGKCVDRSALLHNILAELIDWRGHLGTDEFIHAWERWLAYRGEQVQVWAEGELLRAGRVSCLDRDGSLILEGLGGEVFSIRFGEVHLRSLV